MTTSKHRSDLLIDGEWTSTFTRFEVLNPASMEVLAQVADATPEDALEAVGSAHEAFSSWSQTAPRHRAEILRRAFEITTAEIEDCARLITLENGKAWADAMGEAT